MPSPLLKRYLQSQIYPCGVIMHRGHFGDRLWQNTRGKGTFCRDVQ